MKKIILATSMACFMASSFAAADTPINSGRIDITVTPIGYNAAGVRYAVNEKIAVYGLIHNLFDVFSDTEEAYNATSERYEENLERDSNELRLSAGLQYFLLDNIYTTLEFGIYRYDETTDFASGFKEEESWTGVNGMVALGYEQTITDRLSGFTSANYEFGSRDATIEEFDPDGDLDFGRKRELGYTSISYRLGFNFSVN